MIDFDATETLDERPPFRVGQKARWADNALNRQYLDPMGHISGVPLGTEVVISEITDNRKVVGNHDWDKLGHRWSVNINGNEHRGHWADRFEPV